MFSAVPRAAKTGSSRKVLAENLRTFRGRLGLSQEALADRAGLHRTYVGSIERCERNVSLDNIERLANALGVRVAELLQPGRAAR
jgi:transcriptional regulator with XRE-family HTH domain